MRCAVIHRWLWVPLGAAVLYGGTLALATDLEGTAPFTAPPSLSTPTELPETGFVPQPSGAFPAAPGATAVPSPSATPPRQAPHVELPPPPAGVVTSHIALLLPLDSLAFAKHAEAVLRAA